MSPGEVAARSGTSPPLVSCVMVTAGRAAFVGQSVRYFLEQDYPERELVIVHEDGSDLPLDLPSDPRIRAVRVAGGLSIGAKRNAGTALARGELVAQWDDDDWYSPARLGRQVAPLLAGSADITGLRGALFFELSSWTFWACGAGLHARMFVEDVLGGTLVFRRSVWAELAKYPPTSLREDADFLVAAIRHGARLSRVAAEGLFVYVRHGGNTWRFAPGQLIDPLAWRVAPEPAGMAAARDFYLARTGGGPARARRPEGRPRVSCIMPTYDRPEFVSRAIRHFTSQTYRSAELIVVDDSPVAIRALVPETERIHYLRLDARASIGQKRNIACAHASGEIVVHWDDDDWMAPTWLEAQVDALLASGAQATGLARPYFYDPVRREAFRYEYPRRARPWVHGGTLCYPLDVWRETPFADTSQGEDVRFLWGPTAKKIVGHERADLYVAYLHRKNASPKPRSGPRWSPRPAAEVERLWFAAARRAPAEAEGRRIDSTAG